MNEHVHLSRESPSYYVFLLNPYDVICTSVHSVDFTSIPTYVCVCVIGDNGNTYHWLMYCIQVSSSVSHSADAAFSLWRVDICTVDK